MSLSKREVVEEKSLRPPVSTEAQLSVRSLRKTYRNGIVALDGIDLEIARGDFFGLIGANGAGKSTLIGILTGLVTKTGGELWIGGIDFDQDPCRARLSMGVVPQELNLNIFEKPLNILINQAGYFGIKREPAAIRAKELLLQLGLWDKRYHEVRTLSGGMKRRLMIARALVHTPQFLLLDEPTAGLDVELRRSTWEYLKLLNNQGLTILLTSHYLEEIEQLCSHAAMIQRGKILKVDTVHNLVHSLDEQLYVVKFVGPGAVENISEYNLTEIEDGSWEVFINGKDTLTHFVMTAHQFDLSVKEIHTKCSRLEQLFLNVSRTLP